MMRLPLLTSSILTDSVGNHPDQTIVTAAEDGTLHEFTYAEFDGRVRALATGLREYGVGLGARIGTLAWNTHRHREIYYAVSGIGAVYHTENPRLSLGQFTFIVNHSRDSVVFFDQPFSVSIRRLRELCPWVRYWVLLEDQADREPGFGLYSDWLTPVPHNSGWPELDENLACGLCYTSGTTGEPKGALYSHRSTVLHAYGSCHPDALGISARDTVMPLVTLFHVNAWGLPYSALLSGARLVLPGSDLRGPAIHALCQRAGVTLTAGLPTVFQGLLDHLATTAQRPGSLKRVVIGGSACPPHMMDSFHQLGVTVLYAWGMTEVSPLGTVCRPLLKHEGLSPQQKGAVLASQGSPLFGVQLKVLDAGGRSIPRGGLPGQLRIRGNRVIERCLGHGRSAAADGWFDTGDVATLDHDGYLRVTDRTKDVINSGWEWIWSIKLENIAMEDPAVEIAACVAIRHAKWGERPLIAAVARPGQRPEVERILTRYDGRVARYARPQQVIFIDRMPLRATGKIQKTALRKLPEVAALCT